MSANFIDQENVDDVSLCSLKDRVNNEQDVDLGQGSGSVSGVRVWVMVKVRVQGQESG